MTRPSRPDLRAKEITLIHIAKAQLGLDEATYRAQIQRISQGRTASSAALNAMERDSLLAEYRLAGWEPTAPKRAAANPAPAQLARTPMLTKVEALLTDQGLPWSYAEAILRRQRGILDRAVACPVATTTPVELRGLIAALARRAKRHPPTPRDPA